jgi:hypothetical protein
MKKLFVIATMVATATFASCSGNTDIDDNSAVIINADAPQVHLTLGAGAGTRAFFDNTATAETWESEITALTVYAFDKSGNPIVKRSLTAPEVTAKSARFSLPNSVAGTNCSFYVVANADYGNAANAKAMDALTETVPLDDYNGTFTQISGARKRTAGFVMTGKTTATVAAAGSSTTVGVTLRRTVAKVAVRTAVAPSFTATYGGGVIVINSVKLSRASALSNSFYKTPLASRTSLYEFTQTTHKNGSNFDALMYVYENGALGAGSRVLLTLKGYFDADGSDTTTYDRSDVEYKVELEGSTGGEIKRNGYYMVDITINDLAGDSFTVVITTADWENPVTQTVNLGK